MSKRWPFCALLAASLLVGRASAAMQIPNALQPFQAHPTAQRVTTDGRQVFVLRRGALRSFDATLTKLNWKVLLKSYGGLAVGDGLVVADNGFNTLLAYEALTGRELWQAAAPRSLTWGGTAPIQTPLTRLQVVGGTVLAAASEDVRAWDAHTGTLLWKVSAADASGLSGSGNVVTFSARSGLDGYQQAVNKQTGLPLWTLKSDAVGGVINENGGLPYLYSIQSYTSRPRLQFLDVRTGRNVVVEYQFPKSANPDIFLQRDTLCAAANVGKRAEVTCLPRTAGRYVGGDKRLLPVLLRIPPGPAMWEQQVRRIVPTQRGTWLLGGVRAVQLQPPAMYAGCALAQAFAEAGQFAVFPLQCGHGKGRIAVVDQATGKVVRVVMGQGNVTAAHLIRNRLIIVTDRSVLSVPAPRTASR